MFKKIENKKGFTLIELLIIIFIIFIIAGIILVAVNPAKRIQESNDSRRWSDVKSISSAINAYIADNRGDVPNCAVGGDIPSDNIYHCLGSGPGIGLGTAEGLVSWWSFEEGAGQPRNDQISASANHLTDNTNTNQNSNKVQGDFSASFNGTSNYLFRLDNNLSVNFPGSNVGDYSLTVSAWVKISNANDMIVAAKYGNAAGSWSLGIGDSPTSPRQISVVLKDQTEDVHFIADTPLTVEIWHHIAFTYNRDNNEVVIYLDGQEDFRETKSFVSGYPPESIFTDFTIGWSSASAKFMAGLIDELAVFNKALTAEQIQEIYYFGLSGSRPCCDLSADLSSYLYKMPQDPTRGTDASTGYAIKRNSAGTIWINAPFKSAYTSSNIEVSR